MFQNENNSDKIGEVILDKANLEQNINSTHSNVSSHPNSPKRLQTIGFFYKDKEISCSMIWRESFFFLALILTTYGALYNAPPKISRQPVPLPFFESGSGVKDWYKGQLSSALSHMLKFEVSFVMYYAPWDAECHYTRNEFVKAAQIMGSQVHFSAVNCWNPGSECRLQHGKVPSWPVLMVYTSTSKSVMYKGPRNAQSMIRFLNLILRPLRRINGYDDLIALSLICEAIAVGYTPLEYGSKSYNTLYSVALKLKEKDPFGDLCFAVVTSEKTAHEMDVENLPNLHLVLWNVTLEYTQDGTMTEDGMSRWLWSTMVRPSARIVLPWTKMNTLQPFVEVAPVIIMFAPLNPLYYHSTYYNLFRAVAMEYHNCENNPAVNGMIDVIQENSFFEAAKFKMMTESCKIKTAEYLKKYQQGKEEAIKRAILSIHKRQWLNKTSCKSQNFKKSMLSHLLQKNNNYCITPSSKASASEAFKFVATGERTGKSSPVGLNFNGEDCNEEQEVTEQHLSLENSAEVFQTSMLPKDDDPLSSANLKIAFYQFMCGTMIFAHKVHEPTFPKVDVGQEKVMGLACKTNLTLSFIALDTIENHHFAESLGIELNSTEQETAIVILDPVQESQYIMKEQLTTAALKRFILNFTTNGLTRSFKTVTTNLKNTHHYCLPEEKCIRHCPSGLCLVELSSHTFLNFIMDPSKFVIVAHCGGSCDPHTTRTILTVSKILMSSNINVSLGRIDGAQHDLPWSFTASKYPTIVVYPAHKKHDSRTYPESQRISIEGLLALVLSCLDPPANIRAKLTIAYRAKNTTIIKGYLTDIRMYVSQIINSSLRQWRRMSGLGIKRVILRRLQSLRTISLTLGALNSTALSLDHPLMSSLHEALNGLETLWNVKLISRHTSDTEKRVNKISNKRGIIEL